MAMRLIWVIQGPTRDDSPTPDQVLLSEQWQYHLELGRCLLFPSYGQITLLIVLGFSGAAPSLLAGGEGPSQPSAKEEVHPGNRRTLRKLDDLLNHPTKTVVYSWNKRETVS